MRQDRRVVLLSVVLAVGACASPPLTTFETVGHREPLVDVIDYEIDVALDHEAGLVDGSVHVTFAARPGRPADTLLLHALDMTIEGVWDERGEALAHEYDGTELEIELGRSLAPGTSTLVSVDYRATPVGGLHFVGPTRQDPGRAWSIWTQGQAEDTRRWVPVWDVPNDRATHTLVVTVDEAFMTMAAGTRTDSRPHRRRGTRTDTWRTEVPHPSYLITLVAGELAVGMLADGPVPLPVVTEPEDLDRALENFALTGEMLELFGELTGRPYPYPKYAQSCVRDFTAGGMENISATTLYYHTLHDPDDEPQVSSNGLLAHEAAHQWFGDLLTCRSWNHIWLNEGFATYYEALFTEHHEGPDAFAAEMLGNQRSYVTSQIRAPKPIVWPRVEDPDDVFDAHAYPGGASVLHLLHDQLGEVAYHEAIARYVAEHEADVVVTEDLRRALEASTGRDLSRFFEQWLHTAGVPIVRTRLRPGDGGGHVLRVEQLQGGHASPWDGLARDVFAFDVTVAWSRDGVERRERFTIDERVEALPLGPGPIDWVRFDAGTVVPMFLEHRQDQESWTHQLRHGGDGVTRLVAAQWFAGNRWVRREEDGQGPSTDDAVAALVEAAHRDRFAPVRAAALDALALTADEPRAVGAALALIEDADARVREAAARALGRIGDDGVLPSLAHATSDRNGSVVLAALRALDRREYPGAFTVASSIYEETDKMRVQNGVVALIGGLPDDERTVPFLIAAARHSEHRRVRAGAMAALGRQPGHDDVVLRELLEGLGDPSHQVRAAAARALGRRGDDRARDALRGRRVVEGSRSVHAAIDGALRGIYEADRSAPRAGR